MIARADLIKGGTTPSGRWTTIASWRGLGESLVAVFDHPEPHWV